MDVKDVRATVASTQEYYDGPADVIYRTIWRDNVHLGVPCRDDCPHPEAMEHTNEIMAQEVGQAPGASVLDLGCGYGSSARFLAANYGYRVTGVNISEKELELARQRANQAGLEHLLTFEYCDFHSLHYPDSSFDVVWSQESFLHAVDKLQVLSECRRVLCPEGSFVFTDVLVRKGTPEADRARIYERVRSPDMWDLQDYTDALTSLGFHIRRVEDWSPYVARSYGWVRDQVVEHRDALSERIDLQTIDRTVDALTFWVDSAKAGKIGWGLFVADYTSPSPRSPTPG